jgi:hypothetical protein
MFIAGLEPLGDGLWHDGAAGTGTPGDASMWV